MNGFKDWYAVLGVAPWASPEVIRAAYRVLAQQHHPDRQKTATVDSETMCTLNQAYAALSCPVRRQAYDQWREAQTQRQHLQTRSTPALPSSPLHAHSVLTTYDRRGRLQAFAT